LATSDINLIYYFDFETQHIYGLGLYENKIFSYNETYGVIFIKLSVRIRMSIFRILIVSLQNSKRNKVAGPTLREPPRVFLEIRNRYTER